MDVGDLVRAARVERGMTTEQLARLVNVSRPQISRIETGSRAASVRVLRGLASVLELDLNALVGVPESAAS